MFLRRSTIPYMTMAIAAVFGSANAAPLDANGTLVVSERDLLPADCQFAQYFFADVDCYYNFEDSSFLNYVIKISPTGQDASGGKWCQGIWDNIQGECGGYAVNAEWETCDDQYQTRNLYNPVTGEVSSSSGINFNFHWNWDWVTTDDETTCITSAIQKATCGATVVFKNDKCYKAI